MKSSKAPLPTQGTLPKGVLPKGHRQKKSRPSNKSSGDKPVKEEATSNQSTNKTNCLDAIEYDEELFALLDHVTSSKLRPSSKVRVIAKKKSDDANETIIRSKKFPLMPFYKEGTENPSIPLRNVVMYSRKRYNKSFLGEQQWDGDMIGLMENGKTLHLPSKHVKLCANEKCKFHKEGIPSDYKTKACKECATSFCSAECHSLSWKEKQQHYYYCKIVSPLYKVFSRSMRECPDYRTSEDFFGKVGEEADSIFYSQEYRRTLDSTRLPPEELNRYLAILSDILVYYDAGWEFTVGPNHGSDKCI